MTSEMFGIGICAIAEMLKKGPQMTNEQIARLLRDMAERRGEDDFAVTDEEFCALNVAADRLKSDAIAAAVMKVLAEWDAEPDNGSMVDLGLRILDARREARAAQRTSGD